MKMCQPHWDVCREAIRERGLEPLVAKSGAAAMANIKQELEGATAPFDPLMSMNNHWWGNALQNGGLYLMGVDVEANPHNEGHYCPLCEFEKHREGFVAKDEVGAVADQMADYARANGLIAKVQ